MALDLTANDRTSGTGDESTPSKMQKPLRSMEYEDDEKLDRIMPDFPEPPDYPQGLQFNMQQADLAKIVDGDYGPDHTMRFSALGTATSVVLDRDPEQCRIEMSLDHMAGPDGKFVEMDQPPTICLSGPECQKLDLEQQCERGDMLHLIGSARVERTSDHEFGATATLQITDLCVEDESEESRG